MDDPNLQELTRGGTPFVDARLLPVDGVHFDWEEEAIEWRKRQHLLEKADSKRAEWRRARE